jgi:hypothetical protein
MATLSFYTVIGCHWLLFLRDLHGNLGIYTVILLPLMSFLVQMTVLPRANRTPACWGRARRGRTCARGLQRHSAATRSTSHGALRRVAAPQ